MDPTDVTLLHDIPDVSLTCIVVQGHLRSVQCRQDLRLVPIYPLKSTIESCIASLRGEYGIEALLRLLFHLLRRGLFVGLQTGVFHGVGFEKCNPLI